MKDIFALQDKITLEILKALNVKLTFGEGHEGPVRLPQGSGGPRALSTA
jgi:hypothetical protein